MIELPIFIRFRQKIEELHWISPNIDVVVVFLVLGAQIEVWLFEPRFKADSEICRFGSGYEPVHVINTLSAITDCTRTGTRCIETYFSEIPSIFFGKILSINHSPTEVHDYFTATRAIIFYSNCNSTSKSRIGVFVLLLQCRTQAKKN